MSWRRVHTADWNACEPPPSCARQAWTARPQTTHESFLHNQFILSSWSPLSHSDRRHVSRLSCSYTRRWPAWRTQMASNLETEFRLFWVDASRCFRVQCEPGVRLFVHQGASQTREHRCVVIIRMNKHPPWWKKLEMPCHLLVTLRPVLQKIFLYFRYIVSLESGTRTRRKPNIKERSSFLLFSVTSVLLFFSLFLSRRWMKLVGNYEALNVFFFSFFFLRKCGWIKRLLSCFFVFFLNNFSFPVKSLLLLALL